MNGLNEVPTIKVTLPPTVPSMNRPGIIIQSEDQRQRAFVQLRDDVADILRNYEETKDIVVFATRVQKITCLFQAIQAARCPHHELSALEVTARNIIAEPFEKLIGSFESAVRVKEVEAIDLLGKEKFELAHEAFSKLSQALSYERGSIRYFSIQSWVLTTRCALQKTSEAIELLVELEQDVPDDYMNWHRSIWRDLSQYVDAQFKANEQEFLVIQQEIERCSSQFNVILSTDGLSKGVTEEIAAVQKAFTSCGERLERCQTYHTELARFAQQLRTTVTSQCEGVSESFGLWHARSTVVADLVGKLVAAEGQENQVLLLCDWITSNIDSYNNDNFFALHTCVLSMLLQYYFMSGLSETSCQRIVGLLTTYADQLVPHLRNVSAKINSQHTANEAALKGVGEVIGKAVEHMREVFSAENTDKEPKILQKMVRLIDEALNAERERIENCQITCTKLNVLGELLTVRVESCCVAVTERYTSCTALCANATALLESLDEVIVPDEKNVIYREWILANLGAYQDKTASALHGWVVLMVAKLYFSHGLSEGEARETAALLQTHAACLVPHLMCLRGKLEADFQANEKKLESIGNNVAKVAKRITEIFTTDGLEASNQFSELTDDLIAENNVLTDDLDTLKRCKVTYEKLTVFNSLLNIHPKSRCDEVTKNHESYATLCSRAITLLKALDSCGSIEEKHEALLVWIREELHSYDCPAKDLSRVHNWALFLLGRYYFSDDLSDTALENTVALLRTNASRLFPHLKAFPHDVVLVFDAHQIQMSLLVLTTISGRLAKMHGTQEGVALLKAVPEEEPSWGEQMNGITSIFGRWKPFAEKVKVLNAKPEVNLNDLSRVKVEHIRNREDILHHLLTAFQYYNFDLLVKMETEDTVAVFEIACDLLEMPVEIVEDLGKRLQTYEFEQTLKPLQWLRLCQARKVPLDYKSLRAKLPDVTLDDFLSWIRLYDPERIEVDPKQHDKLFFALALAAENLFQKDQFKDPKEIAETFQFLERLFAKLITLPLDQETREKLETKLIQFGCRCVAKTNDSKIIAFSLVGRADIRSSITCLQTRELEGTEDLFSKEVGKGLQAKNLLNKSVKLWLETNIYPFVQTVVLHKPHDEVGLGDFRCCAAVTRLTMPLPQENGDMRVQELPSVFKMLRHLRLENGAVSVKSLAGMKLESLILNNITCKLDFSACGGLQSTLKVLSLDEVQLVPNSLSWVAASQTLEKLTVKAARGSPIGKLAVVNQTHGKQTLRKLTLRVDRLDAEDQPRELLDGEIAPCVDLELRASLSKLLNSQPKLSKIKLVSDASGSILECLALSDKAAFIETLFITCCGGEDFARLATFKGLTTLLLRTDDPAQILRLTEHKFGDYNLPNLKKVFRVDAEGTKYPIPIRRTDYK